MGFTWFLPSMYGDIKLERSAASSTRLTLTGLSPTEKDAVKALFQRATKPGSIRAAWASTSRIEGIDLDSLKEQVVELDAPISKVQEFLQKQLKPHRKQISAVRFTNGHVEQLSEATLQVIDAPARSISAADELAQPQKKPEKHPTAAVTVAQPVLGCPAPDFNDVEIRATRVLKAFLTPEQVEDFERRQQFVTIGADTGHRYLLTSRHSKHALSQHQSYRSLYDMDERTPFCVHDWEVPAAEELLGLHVHVSLPGLEQYVRNIPDRDGILTHAR
jgi:hypothetical protein